MEKEEIKVETISKDEIEKVVNLLNETKKNYTGQIQLTNIEETIRTISGFEGYTHATVMNICTASLIFLSSSEINTVLELGKLSLRAKALSEVLSNAKEKYFKDIEEGKI